MKSEERKKSKIKIVKKKIKIFFFEILTHLKSYE